MAELALTRELAARAVALHLDDVDPASKSVARQCLLDWFGVTLAGSSETCTAILADEAKEQGGHAQATLLGRGIKVASRQAALINGTASHAHDYDDVNLAMNGHVTVAVAGGVLALAEQLDATGADVLTAFIAGYEAACAAGQIVLPSHYGLGFHATATIGTIGAAVGCGRLLGLDVDQMARAMGIAGTMAAGLKAQFGTDCKPFHAGRATESGLLAASMAKRGFTSAGDILENRQGFAAAMSRDFHPEAALKPVKAGFHVRNNLFKYHAACYITHAAIECGLNLRERLPDAHKQIAEATIRADRSCDTVCNIQSPGTGLEAKFSLRMTAAMALSGLDTASLTSFSDTVATDPEMMPLRDSITVELVDRPSTTWSDLTLTLKDGSTLSAEYDSGIPARDVAVQGQRIRRKFDALADPVLGGNRAAALADAIENIEHQKSIADLMHLAA